MLTSEAKQKSPVEEKIHQESLYRIHIFGLIVFIVFFIILVRVIYIETAKHEYYLSLAKKQYVHTIDDSFQRGSVYFSSRKKDPVPVAQLRSLYSLVIDTTLLKDATSTYETLNTYIPIDKDFFLEKASKVNDPYEKIADDIPEDVVALLQKEKLKGVTFSKKNYRGYPQGEVGSKVVGFVGFSGETRKGQYGIERYYDDILNRSNSESKTNFFAELFSDIADTSAENTDTYEGDVLLTIDAEAQRFLNQTLIETKKEWKSDTIGGIIMDPKTGAIIAMDALPTYDPNRYQDVKDPSFFSNPLVSSVYEMGSIIKPLTVASALDANVVNESTTYDDKGTVELNGYKVRNFDSVARGVVPIQTILDKSLNVGIVFLVQQLGAPLFQEYFKKLGFGQETGIDLPNEAKGLTKNLDSSVFVDSATSGFGQGIALTPIQTIRALAALGNGGVLVNPHVVDQIMFEDGQTKTIVPDAGVQVFKPETSEKISRMLVHVVDTALKNGTYKMDHYTIAAKTGTAQIAQPGAGYYDDRYLHSFFGYVPAYDPKFVIFLFHTNPKGAEYASATLTDPFFKVVKFLLAYYEVPPDR